MKKTVSFNLEEDIIEKIEEYQKQNKLSSRSAALERIILALDNNKNDNINLNEIIKQLLQSNINSNANSDSNSNSINIENTEEVVVENEDLNDTVNDILGTMK